MLKIKCIKKEYVNNVLIYFFVDENNNKYEYKTYDVKEKIRRKEIYITNMKYIKGKLFFVDNDYFTQQEKISYEERVNAFLKPNNSYPLFVGYFNSNILLQVSKKNYPISLNKKKAKEISKKPNESGHGNHHSLTYEELLALPYLISNPYKILKLKKDENKLILITNLIREGKNIVIIMHCNGKRDINKKIYTVHKIASIYPKKYSEITIYNKYEIIDL